MEEALEKLFLPDVFQGATAEVTMQGINRPKIKQAGLAITNSTLPPWENCTASSVVTRYLVAYLHGRKQFKSGYHVMLLWEGHREIRHHHVQEQIWRSSW